MTLNLTSMVDVVFLLLFFFMVTSRFGGLEGLLPAQLPAQRPAPQALAAATIPRTPIRVRLVFDPKAPGPCRVTVERFAESPIGPSEMAGVLERIRTQEPGFDADTPVYLLAADAVAWNDVVNAYNAALAARYQKIFFAGSQ